VVGARPDLCGGSLWPGVCGFQAGGAFCGRALGWPVAFAAGGDSLWVTGPTVIQWSGFLQHAQPESSSGRVAISSWEGIIKRTRRGVMPWRRGRSYPDRVAR